MVVVELAERPEYTTPENGENLEGKVAEETIVFKASPDKEEGDEETSVSNSLDSQERGPSLRRMGAEEEAVTCTNSARAQK